MRSTARAAPAGAAAVAAAGAKPSWVACTALPDVVGVLPEQRPGVRPELVLRLLVEAARLQHLLEGRGVGGVEGEALALEPLLQVDVQPGDVVPLLLRRLAEVPGHDLLHVGRHVLPA